MEKPKKILKKEKIFDNVLVAATLVFFVLGIFTIVLIYLTKGKGELYGGFRYFKGKITEISDDYIYIKRSKEKILLSDTTRILSEKKEPIDLDSIEVGTTVYVKGVEKDNILRTVEEITVIIQPEPTPI